MILKLTSFNQYFDHLSLFAAIPACSPIFLFFSFFFHPCAARSNWLGLSARSLLCQQLFPRQGSISNKIAAAKQRGDIGIVLYF